MTKDIILLGFVVFFVAYMAVAILKPDALLKPRPIHTRAKQALKFTTIAVVVFLVLHIFRSAVPSSVFAVVVLALVVILVLHRTEPDDPDHRDEPDEPDDPDEPNDPDDPRGAGERPDPPHIHRPCDRAPITTRARRHKHEDRR